MISNENRIVLHRACATLVYVSPFVYPIVVYLLVICVFPARSRVRRQAGDMRVAHLRAENALKQLAPKACAETGCGLIDIITR